MKKLMVVFLFVGMAALAVSCKTIFENERTLTTIDSVSVRASGDSSHRDTVRYKKAYSKLESPPPIIRGHWLAVAAIFVVGVTTLFILKK